MNDFSRNKIPICNSIMELKVFLLKYPNTFFCLYLAYKDDDAWNKSTSREYMNQVCDNLIYLPVNIQKNDFETLKEIYSIAESNKQIIAINQTQPHKSNPVLKKWLNDDSIKNIDTLIKNDDYKLIPYDLNGPSFVEWFIEEVDEFKNKFVILLGVGGVGEPMARKIISKNPKQLLLVDKIDKSKLVNELSNIGNIKYTSELKINELDNDEIILINCAGKEGSDDSIVDNILKKYRNKNQIFVDLRPQLKINIVEKAQKLGWNSFSGFGMNARNDYLLYKKICVLINEKPISFKNFKLLVAHAS